SRGPAAHSQGPPALGNADATWPMVSATAREKRQHRGQPMPMAAPPTLLRPIGNEVIPPARTQMVDIARAKLANGPIARAGAG
ncbi:MAG TPA: hypothetical protein VM597_15355, partial [Gemmataceae bacterium]|nr:hypothetical protein [Gemmataceae bacterium]